MNTLRLVVALISMVLAVNVLVGQEAAAPAAPAAPAAAPRALRLPGLPKSRRKGIINVTKDVTGKVEDVRLVLTSYPLVLNDKSKALETMAGKKVKVFGAFKREEGIRIFYVTRFEVIEPKEKDADKKPAEKPAKKPAAK